MFYFTLRLTSGRNIMLVPEALKHAIHYDFLIFEARKEKQLQFRLFGTHCTSNLFRKVLTIASKSAISLKYNWNLRPCVYQITILLLFFKVFQYVHLISIVYVIFGSILLVISLDTIVIAQLAVHVFGTKSKKVAWNIPSNCISFMIYCIDFRLISKS